MNLSEEGQNYLGYPCPFCGGGKLEFRHVKSNFINGTAVSCEECRATGSIGLSSSNAVELWNLRDQIPAKRFILLQSLFDQIVGKIKEYTEEVKKDLRK